MPRAKGGWGSEDGDQKVEHGQTAKGRAKGFEPPPVGSKEGKI